MQDPVFIVNTGRCGSTMLAEMLHCNRRWLVLSEYLSYLSSYALPQRALTGQEYWDSLATQSPVLREMHLAGQRQAEVLYEQGRHGEWPLHEAPAIMLTTLPFLSDNPLPLFRALEESIRPRARAPVAEHMRVVFSTLARQTSRGLWIERTGDSLLLVGVLRRMFPGARFVHLYRDGRDVACSMRRKPDFRAKVSYYRTLRGIGLNPYRSSWAYGVAPWHRWVEHLGSRILDVRFFTDAQVSLEQCGQHWAWMIEAGLAELDHVPPENLHSIRYEDLVTDPQRVLSDLGTFLEGENDQADWLLDAERLSKGLVSYWRDLPEADQEALTRVGNKQLEQLGYRT